MTDNFMVEDTGPASPKPVQSNRDPFAAKKWRLGVTLCSAGIAGRLAVRYGLTLFCLLLVTFVLGRMLPIDPVIAVVGDHASPAARALAQAKLGLDRPIWLQFLSYTDRLLRGDLGHSLLNDRPVLDDILDFLPATLELATTATLIGLVVGVPAGVGAAAFRGRLLDSVLRIIMIAGYSVPVFWLGIAGLVLFYTKLGWVSGPGRISIAFEGLVPVRTGSVFIDAVLAGDAAAFFDAAGHLALPAAILGYYSASLIGRMTRSAMTTELQQEYVLTARLKGLSRTWVLWHHALPNARLPIITTALLSYAYLLEGAVLTETIFAWPGLGLYITQSLFSADLAGVLGATLVIGVSFISLNVLADQLSRLADPRLS